MINPGIRSRGIRNYLCPRQALCSVPSALCFHRFGFYYLIRMRDLG